MKMKAINKLKRQWEAKNKSEISYCSRHEGACMCTPRT